MATLPFRSLLARACVASLALAACGNTEAVAPLGGAGGGFAAAIPEVRSAIPHAVASVAAADQAIFIADAETFSFELYRKVAAEPAQTGKNVFLSPLSVSFALGMTSAGAKGATLTEMRTALRLTLPEPTTHESFNWLKTELMKRPAAGLATLEPDLVAGSHMDFNLVDALFAQTGFQVVPAFLDTLSAQYDAGVKLVDFIADADGSRKTINTWVDTETTHRIQDLLPPGSITSDVRIVTPE